MEKKEKNGKLVIKLLLTIAVAFVVLNAIQLFVISNYTKSEMKKTSEDAYVAIDTMLASLNDPYTRFLDPKEFEELLDKITISAKDKDLMRMRYIEEYDFYYIADELGYSRSGILKRHSKILSKLKNYL